ncbi:MAG TPA: EAL domain-containing protein [Rhodocyclaceae bacterium]|nr:EAL domain-containing protein [Rhodocyclaceae bacterium]
MKHGTPARRIALLYLIVSLIWIAVSDQLLAYIITDPDTLTTAQTWKGWGFVTASALLIGWLVQREMDYQAATHKALMEAREELDSKEQRYQHMFAESPLPMWVYDASDYRTLAVNQAAIDHYGYSREEWLNLTLLDLRPTRPDAASHDPLLRIIPDVRSKGIWRHAKKDGTVMEMEIASHDLDFEGRKARMVIATDVTEQRKAESRIYHLAYFDPLTELPNRALLIARLENAIEEASRSQGKLALMFFDLDRFKDINDSLGHQAGDQLLKEVASRLSRVVPPGATVARMSADLFALLIVGADLAQSQQMADRALASLSGAMDLGSVCMVEATACMGIALFPDHCDDAQTLMRNAEAALHHAIDKGRNQYAFYETGMNDRSLERLALENELRQGLERDEFILHYQPQVSLTGKINGVEALVRWNHPTRGLLPPGRFIALAEDSGLIVPLGAWVLREACRQGKKWLDQGLPPLTMAVNLSAIQFHQPRLAEHIAAILAESGLPPKHLEVEVTESILMGDTNEAAATLEALRAMDVKISIDDFGTGYSSLAYLGQLPVNKLKIDQSFVRKLPTDRAAAAITTTIIALAKNLDLTVIAEGVETEEQAGFLRERECDEAQGYLYSRPVAAGEVERLMGSGERKAG